RMLIAFVDDIAPAPKPEPLPEVRPHADWPSFDHRFTEDDWTGDFKTKGERADASLLPEDWAQFSGLSLPSPVGDECAQLRDAENKERPGKTRQINWEAKSWRHAVNELLELVGDLETPPMRVQTLELLRRVDQSIDAPLFALKKHFMRGRPGKSGHCVDAMFPGKHAFHPGHPSYPSGHATMAHAVSLVLGEIAPGTNKDALAAAAERIGRRREVAGLHYPSDSAAGRSLAAWLVTQLKKNPDFQALMRNAASEWAPAAPATP
ncbi:MAG: phosphatase PAP2 family protein, partial [Aquincola sp.]|nr:phosphatase PAP2 family protein [Aquincola sp.]